jgi:hypothetical protein
MPGDAALPSDHEPTVDAITWAYVEAADGDALAGSASSVAPIGGPIYWAANRLMEEIDLVAEVLTGNRRHFWLKPHSTPGSSKPTGPQPDSYDAEWERRKDGRIQRSAVVLEDLARCIRRRC